MKKTTKTTAKKSTSAADKAVAAVKATMPAARKVLGTRPSETIKKVRAEEAKSAPKLPVFVSTNLPTPVPGATHYRYKHGPFSLVQKVSELDLLLGLNIDGVEFGKADAQSDNFRPLDERAIKSDAPNARSGLMAYVDGECLKKPSRSAADIATESLVRFPVAGATLESRKRSISTRCWELRNRHGKPEAALAPALRVTKEKPVKAEKPAKVVKLPTTPKSKTVKLTGKMKVVPFNPETGECLVAAKG